ELLNIFRQLHRISRTIFYIASIRLAMMILILRLASSRQPLRMPDAVFGETIVHYDIFFSCIRILLIYNATKLTNVSFGLSFFLLPV
ncbi:hypothetical protein L9F63_014067, partial [Diploptera punctata]